MSGASKPAQRLEWIDKGRRPGLVMVEHIVAGGTPADIHMTDFVR